MTFEAADQIGGEERVDARLGLFGDEVAEARQGHAGRTALVDDCRYARAHADHVGVQAEPAGHILVDMGMRVDEARQHELAGYVDRLRCAARKDRRPDCGDAAAANGDIADSVDARSRTYDAAAAKQEVVTGSL